MDQTVTRRQAVGLVGLGIAAAAAGSDLCAAVSYRGSGRLAGRKALITSPDLYAYAQTKAATMNYVKSLAKEFGPRGIRVNGVAPGLAWTPL